MAASKITSLAGNFGRLWRQGHETFSPEARRIISVQGAGATTYLQGLLTCDLLNAPPTPREEQDEQAVDENTPLVDFSEKLRSACFLDSKGRILTDSLLWKVDENQYYVDVPGDSADSLLAHLKTFVLRRSKVKIVDQSQDVASHVVYGTLNAQGGPPGYLSAMDPRHPSLGMRILSLQGRDEAKFEKIMSSSFPKAEGSYNVIRKLAGVAEGSELAGKIALESNQEFLNAVSFRKGCYLGQELTARVQYTGAIRKRIMPVVLLHTNMSVPKPWIVASQIQEGRQDVAFEGQELTGVPPKLPRISASAAGSLVAMMTGSVDVGEGEEESEELKQMRAHGDALLEEVQTMERGHKIVDTNDGKTIGQIVAKPELGTNVLLAQMRLDRVGLLGEGKWSYMNKVTIGDNPNPVRLLPYLPLWWPEIDTETGKAQEDK
jgi:folate-binding protein YgfZ